MHDPQSIENALRRLMPSAMSEGGQASIEHMLDELAAEEAALAVAGPDLAAGPALRRFRVVAPLAAAAAAAIVALAAGPLWFPRGGLVPPVPVADGPSVTEPSSPAASSMVAVGESDQVQGMVDEGWHFDPDGGAHQAVRLFVLSERSLRDEETGIVVQIQEPREELLYFPVGSF